MGEPHVRTALRPLGYRTAMMGKYLNGYLPKTRHVPPGWTTWDVAGNGYGEFNYNLNENGTLVHYGAPPADYLTDVARGQGPGVHRPAGEREQPFVLEIATFAPHRPRPRRRATRTCSRALRRAAGPRVRPRQRQPACVARAAARR